MNLDAYSPSAPARLKVLAVPVGQIKQSRFERFVRRLQRENVVRLGDVSPDGRPNKTMFSPLAFPDGLIYYNISHSPSPSSHLELGPFEAYRAVLLVVGIVDWHEKLQHGAIVTGDGDASNSRDALSQDLQMTREGHSAALAHRILVFDCEEHIPELPADIALVPPRAKSRTTTIKTVMCDMTAVLLAEMSSYGKSLQDQSTIETPRVVASSLANGVMSSLPPHMTGNARPMSMAVGSRPLSPTVDERDDHRLSMPVHMTSEPGSRTSTPDAQAEFPPHDIRDPRFKSEESIPVSSTSPPRKPSLERATRSQDRSSTSGFGPGITGERERNRGIARVGVVIGSLYLLAGRWPDAIRELSKSATSARANSDYAWQAKATDHLVVCLLMCAWAGMDFKIPDVLRPASELLQTSTSKPSKHSPSNSQHDISVSRAVDAEKFDKTLQAFAKLLPDLIYNILNLYERAYTFTDDKIPPLSYNFTTIRLVKLLAALHISQGELKQEVVRSLVTSTNAPTTISVSTENNSSLSKSDIVHILLRAHPGATVESSLLTSDRLSILAAIAGVLSELEQYRKVAVILREMVSTLLPSLIQARKDDAAEMGIHPAASLAALNSPMKESLTDTVNVPMNGVEEGMRSFLNLACQVLGLPSHLILYEEPTTQPMVVPAMIETATQHAISKAYGSRDLKLDVLWACINICEALPDLAGALHYSAVLLRTASSGVAPAPESSNGAPNLPIEEQERLANNINRTLGAAQHLGLRELKADYWDEFLVRNIELVGGSQSGTLTPHSESELAIADNFEKQKAKDPFIHNPFLKPQISAKDPVLVAEEEAVFRVMLQNLFDFDLAVDSISIIADGAQVDCLPQSILVGPYRTQTMLVYATPHIVGNMTIIGCMIKIRGCRERSFSIFNEPWALRADVKGRNLKPSILRTAGLQSASSSQLPNSKPSCHSAGPKSNSLSLKVIQSQPAVTLSGTSLAQSAIMLLEGETKRFAMTVRNTSLTTPADFVLISFTDSTSASVQDALTSKEISASQLYELELDLARSPTLQLYQSEQPKDLRIEPLTNLVLDIEVSGKLGLTSGVVLLDYGFLGVSKSEVKEQFYTRQLAIPITITVNPSIHLEATNILRANNDVGSQVASADPTKRQDDSVSPTFSLLNSTNLPDLSTDCCILVLDYRNAWNAPLTLSIHGLTRPKYDAKSSIYHYPIQPGRIVRMPIPVQRTYLSNSKAHAPIPSLNPATKRQFVVSSAPTSSSAEREAREAFWYRESILSQFSATWTEDSTGRTGKIDLRRNLNLSPKMIAAYKLDDIGMTMSVALAPRRNSDKSEQIQQHVKKVGINGFEVVTSSFLTLQTKLYNRSASPIRPILRLQPALANQAQDIALDLHRKLLVHGSTQRILPEIGAGEEAIVETGFIVLSAGTYEWTAIIEEVMSGEKDSHDVREMNGPHKRKSWARIGELHLSIEDEGRRTWFAERSCVVKARDEQEDEDD